MCSTVSARGRLDAFEPREVRPQREELRVARIGAD
jgi:hypothetical protein